MDRYQAEDRIEIEVVVLPYRGTSLARKRTPPGPNCRPMPRVLRGSWVGGLVLMGEVPLYSSGSKTGLSNSCACMSLYMHVSSSLIPLSLPSRAVHTGLPCSYEPFPPPGPYSSLMPRALWWSYGGGVLLMSKVPRYT